VTTAVIHPSRIQLVSRIAKRFSFYLNVTG